MFNFSEVFPYKFDKQYSKPVAYFSMEFAVDQPLKIYSGAWVFSPVPTCVVPMN